MSCCFHKKNKVHPLEDIFDYSCDLIDCDTVTENNLSFLTTLKVEF